MLIVEIMKQYVVDLKFLVVSSHLLQMWVIELDGFCGSAHISLPQDSPDSSLSSLRPHLCRAAPNREPGPRLGTHRQGTKKGRNFDFTDLFRIVQS